MNKQVSPAFVLIVIVVAIALGALYFMQRYRTHEAQWIAEKAAAQREATRTKEAMSDIRDQRESGRRGRSRSGASRAEPGRVTPGDGEPQGR
jgi:uncharacterized protein HemX